MSFSAEVKEELARHAGGPRHCQIAELSAMLLFGGSICMDAKDRIWIRLKTESRYMAVKYERLLRRNFHITPEISLRKGSKGKKSLIYQVLILKDEDARVLLQACKILTPDGQIKEELPLHQGVLLQKNCCKRAFLRGAFLSAGSISDPSGSYHFEIVCDTEPQARLILQLMQELSADAKAVPRKRYYIVYLKEGAQIIDMLAYMEARISLLNMENVRILKEMRGSVNRKVNCETANINKTVNAAVKQLEDIRFIEETIGLSALPNGLDEMARIRLEYPEAPLKELGSYLSPPVGKSGVNHRLRKLGTIADQLRRNKEEKVL